MNRPTITEAMKLEAAKLIAERIDNADAQTIANHWKIWMDGYQLARKLDQQLGWDLCMEDVEELDAMGDTVRELLRTAEKKWAEETNPQPPFPIGTKLTNGIITGIYAHEPARYLVKENGCNNPNRHLIVKFEDAAAAPVTEAV